MLCVTSSEEAVQRHPNVPSHIEFQIVLRSKICADGHHKNGYKNENSKPTQQSIFLNCITIITGIEHVLFSEKIGISGHGDYISQIFEHLHHCHVRIHQTTSQRHHQRKQSSSKTQGSNGIPEEPAAQHAHEKDVDRKPLQRHSGVEILSLIHI